MLGAIIGDIVGSAYEFNSTNDYNFEMFKDGSSFTDDTICTIAIADALLKGRDYGESLHDWCRRYMKPKGGFGGRFRKWVESDHPQPYGSYGNGSAMRVSPIGMWFSDRKEAAEEAKKSAECTHNHKWGIRGAVATVEAIHTAYHDEELRDCDAEKRRKKAMNIGIEVAVDNYYNSSVDLEDYRNRFDETCEGTLPPALHIIANSSSFEDAIRQAVSLGADADTLGAIVGGIAEHIWGIPEWMKQKAMSYLTDEMKAVVYTFYEARPALHGCSKKPRRTSPFDFDKEAYDAYKNALDAQLYFSTGGSTGTLRGRTAPDKINALPKNGVFVFGSNAQGHHAGGAAHAAMMKFGAVWGKGDGLQGQSYAISTMEGLVNTARNVERFVHFAAAHPELDFFVTAIGCGIAGYTPLQIAPLFHKALLLPNVYLPRIFWEYFWMIEGYGPDYFMPNDMWYKWDKNAGHL